MRFQSARTILVSVIIVVTIALDQLTKVLARNYIAETDYLQYLGGTFALLRAENTGAFLSLGSGLSEPLRQTLLLAIPGIVLLLVLGYALFSKNMPKGTVAGLACVVGGGIGNLYDRTVYGSVTDFMLIDINIARTGIFNVADVAIMVGLGLILLNYRKMSRQKAAPTPSE